MTTYLKCAGLGVLACLIVSGPRKPPPYLRSKQQHAAADAAWLDKMRPPNEL